MVAWWRILLLLPLFVVFKNGQTLVFRELFTSSPQLLRKFLQFVHVCFIFPVFWFFLCPYRCCLSRFRLSGTNRVVLTDTVWVLQDFWWTFHCVMVQSTWILRRYSIEISIRLLLLPLVDVSIRLMLFNLRKLQKLIDKLRLFDLAVTWVTDRTVMRQCLLLLPWFMITQGLKALL